MISENCPSQHQVLENEGKKERLRVSLPVGVGRLVGSSAKERGVKGTDAERGL